MSSIYEPQEDSFLLQQFVKEFAFGDVLDLGCGSGIQGIEALKKKEVSSITFVDINEDALNYVEKNVSKIYKPIKFIHSDLFENVKNKFDIIIFNPPYLPEDELDEEKLITTGGKQGYEILDKFFSEVKNHLNKEGIILLVFSSLTDKKQVDKIISENKFKKEELAKKHVFMEDLFVYLVKSK